jgi:hypothetical protein
MGWGVAAARKGGGPKERFLNAMNIEAITAPDDAQHPGPEFYRDLPFGIGQDRARSGRSSATVRPRPRSIPSKDVTIWFGELGLPASLH